MAAAGDALAGQVALVTGAGRGIGRAIALAAARDGAAVACLARSRPEVDAVASEIVAAGGRACALTADVADPNQVALAVSEAQVRMGPLDLLINNAGILGPIAPFAETDAEAWWRVAEVNVKGPMLMARAVLPGMIARGRGRIVNVATGSAPFPYFSAYAATKTALIRFSECLAAEVKAQGLCVFSMSPGTVRTAMSEYSLNSPEGQRWIPWFRRVFDDGLDLPAERPAALAVALGSGRYDQLSGLTVSPLDDLDAIAADLEAVARDKLYSLRLRALPNPQLDQVVALREAGTRASATGLVLPRTFRARRQALFAAWLDAEAWRRWFLPDDGPAQWIDPPLVEPRVGGRLALAVRGPDGRDLHIGGRFQEIARDERLRLAWILPADFPAGGPSESEVTITFEDAPGGCRLLLRHLGLPDLAARDAHERGWRRCFDGLADYLAPRPAPA